MTISRTWLPDGVAKAKEKTKICDRSCRPVRRKFGVGSQILRSQVGICRPDRQGDLWRSVGQLWSSSSVGGPVWIWARKVCLGHRAVQVCSGQLGGRSVVVNGRRRPRFSSAKLGKHQNLSGARNAFASHSLLPECRSSCCAPGPCPRAKMLKGIDPTQALWISWFFPLPRQMMCICGQAPQAGAQNPATELLSRRSQLPRKCAWWTFGWPWVAFVL